jgi:flavin-dependent dehydrogenase
MEPHTVVGAGPAGLVAAATLARAGRPVHVFDQGSEVGHRFAGDFQGLENWSTTQDVLAWMAGLGVEPDFEMEPFHEVTFYDHHLDSTVSRGGSGPLFYLIRRGPMDGTLDRALLHQARAAGAVVEAGQKVESAGRGDILATGPRYADASAPSSPTG